MKKKLKINLMIIRNKRKKEKRNNKSQLIKIKSKLLQFYMMILFLKIFGNSIKKLYILMIDYIKLYIVKKN